MTLIGRFGRIILIALSLALAITTTSIAVTFTSDTYIGPTDFSSDGEDITVTNCTLTIDGTHGFNSLQLQAGGVLTHSAFTNGPQQLAFSVVNEPETLSATTPATLVNTNVATNTIVVMDITSTVTYTQNVDYLVSNAAPFTQLLLTTNSAITSSSSVLVSYTWNQNYQGFNLSISNDLQVLAGGAVNISGKGYASGNGGARSGSSQSTNFPFTFAAGSGGGGGGYGGLSSTFAASGLSEDSTTIPVLLGGSGGVGTTNGGSGGGSGQISIGGTLQVDGQIVADGQAGTNRHSGGGAGGSLSVSAQTFIGAGTMTANGGAGDLPDGGGGGGGRLAIYFQTNNFTGTISTFGGAGSMCGGAGTIYEQPMGSSAAQLIIANNGIRGTNTTFFGTAISNLTISGGAIAASSGFTISNLLIKSGSSIVPGIGSFLSMTIRGDATIESNATVNVDFLSASGLGSGSEGCGAGSGGGFGGFGGAGNCGANGGVSYGQVNFLVGIGSPGGGFSGGGRGGGGISMSVNGTLSVFGSILADGASPAPALFVGGGGSGGGIYLNVGTLTGNGLISAIGGSSDPLAGGAGGGGRIAISFYTNQFTGGIVAHGGGGMNPGGPGTVYISTNLTQSAQVTIDNDGLPGLTVVALPLLADLTITGSSILSNSSGGLSAIRNLFVGSNSSVISASPTMTITANNVTVQSTGRISVDGASILVGGANGGNLNSSGGGGGSAGFGAPSTLGAAGGNPTTNSITSPNVPGGGNGGIGANSRPGGAGGGQINLTASGILQLDGLISANGLPGADVSSGGGGGGSVSFNVGTISGAGMISANGGSGNNLIGGGGSGGCVAIKYQTNQFTGAVVAQGGSGGNIGAAGTVYWNGTNPQLVLANGGLQGQSTPMSFPSGSLDVVVTGGAIATDPSFEMAVLHNLFIGSNSTLQTGQSIFLSNATIQAGGNLNADGMSSTITGQGQTLNGTGSGGSYGGIGGASFTGAPGGAPQFDSISAPNSSGAKGGAGSGPGGNGGGKVNLTVRGTLQLDGKISSQGVGGAQNSGGGSGGSVSLSVITFAGTGLISANGGPGITPGGGGGGGGRIAVNYTTNLFTGSFTAYGGSGINNGGPGTVYLNSSFFGQGAISQLTIDNAGVPGNSAVNNYPSGNLNLTIGPGVTVGNSNSASVTFQNVVLSSNSAFVASASLLQSFTVLSNATIQAGAKFTDDGASPFTGGQSSLQTGGGGGHGGYGGASLSNALGGNAISDPVTQPNQAGTRGGSGIGAVAGGNGGGPIQLTVNGTLQVDGTLSANGVTSFGGNSGGGAGGAVWLTVGKLGGVGTISANGGAGNGVGGGGGGGRISVSAQTNAFSGTISARGGVGGHSGGAGTVYIGGAFGTVAQLLVDNGGKNGTNTSVSGSFSLVDVFVSNGASLTFPFGSPLLNNLTVASNGTVTVSSGSLLSLSITSNLTVQPGGAISMDGRGFGVNAGPGAGKIRNVGTSVAGSGGGHGGYGSSAINTNGGNTYDSITLPTMAGSGGGSLFSGGTGSIGGGILQLTVNGKLQVDGVITANGLSASTNNVGGGSGGSVVINTGTLVGAGRIGTDGGNGDLTSSGGGGGGRIAAYFNSNTFTGTYSAGGGAGVSGNGGAGTIYLKTNSANIGQVIVDNRGAAGTNTPLDSLAQPVALLIRNAAIANSQVPLTLQTLNITSGGSFRALPQNPLNLTLLGDGFIDVNGSIIADGAGYDGTNGPGTGNVDFFGDGSGGGYGGTGGASMFGASGGGTYGLSNQPINFGSAGGISPTVAGFSQGGGAVRMIVDGMLTVNGLISANGNDGVIDGSGGGSGGSVWITTSQFAGSGMLVANGGDGEGSEGGGGGGGRIAVNGSTNLFLGNILVNGGGGAAMGSLGTVYVSTNFLLSGNVIDTNGAPVAGISLQPSGLGVVLTDSNGFYSVPVPIFWSGTVTPTGSALFVPSSRSYANTSMDTTNQNYLAATSAADFNFSGGQFDGTNASFTWQGINGVIYQPYSSSNLMDWAPYGPPIIGTNGPAMFLVPVSNATQLFFRLSVSY